jgi:hypothetical protein
VHDRRRALLTAAAGFGLLPARHDPPEVRMLRRWLDTWTALGLVTVGMARQGYRLHLTNIDDGVWRATFSRAPGLAQDARRAGPGRRAAGAQRLHAHARLPVWRDVHAVGHAR